MFFNCFLLLLLFSGSESMVPVDPAIHASAEVFDFGEVNDRQTLSRPLVLENRGLKTVILERAHIGEDCLLSQVIQNISLPPGKKFNLTISINPQNLHGPQERQVMIYTNDPACGVLELTIKAVIRVDYQLMPAFLYFKNLEAGATSVQSVECRSYMNTPLEIKELVSSHPCFEATFQSDDKGFHIDVQVDESKISAGQGRVTGRILFTTNSELQPNGTLIALATRSAFVMAQSPPAKTKPPVPNPDPPVVKKPEKTIKERLAEARAKAGFEPINPSQSAEGQVDVPAMDPEKCPKILVDKELHDFGEVHQGEEIEAEFLISNGGKGDLKIARVHSGCGCATVNDLKGETIPPGESLPLKVRLSTRNKTLYLHKGITIYSNDPEVNAKRLQIKAYIHVDYLIKGSIPKFGDVRKGMELIRRVEVQSFMDKPLELTNFQCPYDYISCTFGKGENDQDYFIDVTLNAKEQTLPAQPVFGRVTFEANSDQLPENAFSFTLVPIKEIKVEPNKVFLYRYSSTKNEEALLNLTHVEGKPFSIREVVSEIPCLESTITQVAPDQAQIFLRIKEDAEPGRHRTNLTLHLDCENQGLMEIPITVIIRV